MSSPSPLETPLAPAAAYARWAATYDQDRNPLLALGERVMRPFLRRVAGRVALDIGCGTGRNLLQLQKLGAAKAIGIDLAPEMLAAAARKNEADSRLVCADVAALPLRDESIDFALCAFAASYVEDLDAFLSGIVRVSRRGASVIVVDIHPDAYARGWRRTFRDQSGVYEVASTHHSANAFTRGLWRAGFDIDEVSEHCFGLAEREIFRVNGRERLFDEVRDLPAVVMYRANVPLQRDQMRVRPRAGRASSDTLVLAGARVALGSDTAVHADIVIRGKLIESITAPRSAPRDLPRLDLSGRILLPGLINAHDHLEFSLFPRLGRGPYANSSEWAADIHRPQESPVREHRQVPKAHRLWWGGIKNLLSGVTAVSHHNEFADSVFGPGFPVRVIRRFDWTHSLAFGDVSSVLSGRRDNRPFILHAGEGTDVASQEEFDQLLALDAIQSPTVIVHGVAFDDRAFSVLQQRGAALVWCPSSNCFTLGRTLDIQSAREVERLALGTDSSISGAGDLLDEVRFAATQCGASARMLYAAVTNGASDVLRQGSCYGRLKRCSSASLTALRDIGATPAETLVQSSFRDVQFVVVEGSPRLCSPELWTTLPRPLPQFERITVEGCTRYVAAPVNRLLASARAHLGPEIRIGGKRVEA